MKDTTKSGKMFVIHQHQGLALMNSSQISKPVTVLWIILFAQIASIYGAQSRSTLQPKSSNRYSFSPHSSSERRLELLHAFAPYLDGSTFHERYRLLLDEKHRFVTPKIDASSFGLFTLGEDLFTKETVLIKRLFLGTDVSVKAAIRELKALQFIKQNRLPNMIHVRHMFLVEWKMPRGQHPHFEIFIVMDFIDNGSLLRWLSEDCKFTEDQLSHVLYQILKALRALHDHHMAHRDVKPDNVLLTNDWKVLLCDFGIAQSPVSSLGGCHGFAGTLEYMSPEVPKILASGYKTDIWSFGRLIMKLRCAPDIFPETACSKPSTSSTNSIVSALKSMSIDPIKPGQLKECMSSDLEFVVRHCLCVDPRNRMDAKELMMLPYFRNQRLYEAWNLTLHGFVCPFGSWSMSLARFFCIRCHALLAYLFSSLTFQLPRPQRLH